MQFAGTDLPIDAVSPPDEGSTIIVHITPIYVFLDGHRYNRDSGIDLITSLHSVMADGAPDANNMHRNWRDRTF